MVHSQSSFKRRVHNDTDLPQEARKTANKKTKFTLKRNRKKKNKKAQSQSKEGNNKNQRGNKGNRD